MHGGGGGCLCVNRCAGLGHLHLSPSVLQQLWKVERAHPDTTCGSNVDF